MNEIGRPEIGRPRGGKRSPYRRGAQLLLVGLVALAAYTIRAANAAGDDPCTPPVQNPIVCENSKPGSPPSEWDVQGAGDSNIQGFATDISVNRGQTVHFKIDTNATDYRLDIYRMGYYGGDGARKVATVQPSASLPQNQPACLTDAATGLIDCGNWSESASWTVPADAVSGDLLRQAGARGRTPAARATSRSSSATTRATRTSSSRRPTRPGRPTTSTAATASTRAAREPTPDARTRSATTGRSRPAGRPPRTASSTPSTRWSAGSSATATTSATSPASTPTAPRERDPRPQGLHVGRSRRVLVGRRSARTSRPRATPASTSRSSAATRSSGRRAGRTASTAPTRRTAPSSRYKETHANAKIDPDVHQWTGTWRDPRSVRPRGRPPGERAQPARSSRSTAARYGDHRCRRPTARCASGATPASPRNRREPDGDPRRRDARLRVGRGPRQRLAPAGPDRPVVDDGRRRRKDPAGLRVRRTDRAPRRTR